MSFSKKECQKLHAQRRFRERLGIDLNKKLRRELLHNIQSGKYKYLGRQSLRVSLFEATINDKIVHLVYDKIHKTIVTVLLPDQYENYNINKEEVYDR